MKIRLLLALCALTLLLPACKSWEHKSTSYNYHDGYDHAYMAQVERQAAANGTTVIWINPPLAKNGKP